MDKWYKLIRSLGKHFIKIWIKILYFKKMYITMSFPNYWPFCSAMKVPIQWWQLYSIICFNWSLGFIHNGWKDLTDKAEHQAWNYSSLSPGILHQHPPCYMIQPLSPSCQPVFQSCIISHQSFQEVIGTDTMAPVKDRGSDTTWQGFMNHD